MKNTRDDQDRRNLLGPGFILSGIFLLGFFLLRLVLAVWVHGMLETGFFVWARTLWVGIRLDLLAALLLSFPVALGLGVLPARLWQGRVGVSLLRAAFFLGLFLFLFIGTTEVAFFDEFNARFNYIAVDYLLFPTEVAGNIWQSYPVLWILVGVGFLAGVIFFFTHRSLERGLRQSAGWTAKLLILHGVLLVILWLTTPLSSLSVSQNRVQNEVASNGVLTFFQALLTNDLNYDAFYKTLDKGEALRRTKRLLAESEEGPPLEGAPNPLERSLHEDGTISRPNFVIIVEESFGASFTGVLGGRSDGITPSFDRLSKEGLLFTRFYATGSRTVRGLEAILCGFPPIPGVSILKRSKSENVFTLADVVKARGYETLFVYGGRGIFDGMGSFMRANGFDRFIEQKDFKAPVFTTAWGVSDEDIFQRGLEEFEQFHSQGKPFLSMVLTVSNHKPYTYPAGRIDLDPLRRKREHAVKYADWALGQFFDAAQSKGFFKNTIFVVIGDHGARVYGADFIPIHSYEVPFLIYAPFLVKPGRVDTLASSMDVAPTLVGLTDWTIQSVFFGRDLFDVPSGEGYALLQHDRDVGFLRGDRLAVYRPDKSATVYLYDRQEFRFHLAEPDSGDDDLVNDGAALYQTAYELYDQRRLRLKNGRMN
jgi:phosphoglycerol transferase MdoB-like AlkP superfamily enzyme